jgi:hypothetical protein
MRYSAAEREVIALWAACDAVDSLVNHSLLQFVGPPSRTTVVFQDAVHQDLFTARLLDLTKKASNPITQTNDSCIELLLDVASSGAFNEDGFAEFITRSTGRLKEWLETEVAADAWFPSIGRSLSVSCKRREWIELCGNAAKHNFIRLNRVADRLAAILTRNGAPTDSTQALLALPEFEERFHRDILIYHTSTIAELLNNVRWGIQEYLSDEFLRAHRLGSGDPPMETYDIPAFVENDFPKRCYWDLMNAVRMRPFVARFEADPMLKLRY